MFGIFENEVVQLKIVLQKQGHKAIVLDHQNPSRFTVGGSIHCSLTLDEVGFPSKHKLVRSHHGRKCLVIPTDIAFELWNEKLPKRDEEKRSAGIASDVLAALGVIEERGDFFWVPLGDQTRAILRLGKTRLGIEFQTLQKSAGTKDSLPLSFRLPKWNTHERRFALLTLATYFVCFLSAWVLKVAHFDEAPMQPLEMEKRYAKLILEMPAQMEPEKEEIQKAEPEESKPAPKKAEARDKKDKRSKPDEAKGNPKLQERGLLAEADSGGGLDSILNDRQLGNVLDGGVGVLTTKRPKGQRGRGPSYAYRESVNVDDMVSGIAMRQGGYGSGGGVGKKTVTAVSNPFNLSGAGSEHYLRSYSEIDRIIRQHLQSLRVLYERYLRKNPSMRGRVSVKFTINDEGAITQCSLLDSNIQDAEFVQELIKRIQLWKFPPINRGAGSVNVEYPFTFLPKGSS